MRVILCAMAVGLGLLASVESWAATVEPVQGDLSLNQGQGFQRVDGRIDAKVGDSVMVSPDGAATVVYPDGCQVSVQPGAVTTIAPLSPCASDSFAQDRPDWTWSWNAAAPWIVGAGLALGVGFAAYAATRPGPSPASP